MICRRCLRAASQLSKPSQRAFTSSRSTHSQAVPADKATTQTAQRTPTPALSTSAAQPFSSPNQPSPATASGIPTQPSDPVAGPAKTPQDKQAKQKAAPAIVSSVLAGTPLKGLNYFKGKENPVALENHEYPAWLWTVLTPKASTKGEGQIESDPRLFSKSAKARRMANKRVRAQQAADPGLSVPKTPVYEQSVDLPAQEGARHELQRAMREKRRGDIKTANFLKGMR